MYVLIVVFSSYLILKSAWEAHQISRRTNNPIWSIRTIALLEPFVSSLIGTAVLFSAWQTTPWLAPLIMVSPLIFGFIVHRRGRQYPEGRELGRNMFIRGIIGIPATLYIFLFAIGYLDDQYAQWRWVLCCMVLLLVGFMTLIFVRNQSRAIEHAREANTNEQPLALPEEDIHNWSAHEAMIKQLKEDEEKIKIKRFG